MSRFNSTWRKRGWPHQPRKCTNAAPPQYRSILVVCYVPVWLWCNASCCGRPGSGPLWRPPGPGCPRRVINGRQGGRPRLAGPPSPSTHVISCKRPAPFAACATTPPGASPCVPARSGMYPLPCLKSPPRLGFVHLLLSVRMCWDLPCYRLHACGRVGCAAARTRQPIRTPIGPRERLAFSTRVHSAQ